MNFQNSEKWLCSHILLFPLKPAGGRKKNGRSRQIAGKQDSGPIQAGPRRKVSMSQRSFSQNRWENDFLAMKMILKPCLSHKFRVDTPAF